jgi:hypothetical protein
MKKAQKATGENTFTQSLSQPNGFAFCLEFIEIFKFETVKEGATRGT